MKNIDEQISLGLKYLSERNYKEAVLVFDEAIHIDSKNTSVYLYLAEAYIQQNLFDEAKKILESGFEETQSDEIKKKLEEFKSGNIVDGNGQIRKETAYDTRGNLVWYRIYEVLFDVEKNKQEIRGTSYDSNGNITGSCLISKSDSIDFRCGMVEKTGELEQSVVYYDDKHRETRREALDGTGNIKQYEIMSYISENLIKQEWYNSNGLIYYNINENNGKENKNTFYDAKGNMTSYYIQLIEANGSSKSNYDAEGNLKSKEITYRDDNGDTIIEYYDSNGKLVDRRKVKAVE